jgi:hypothetical protein
MTTPPKAPTASEPRYFINYVTQDGQQEQHEYQYLQPVIGNGVQLESGKRYRIVDVWTVNAKRGHFEYGIHAFLEPVTADDDTFTKFNPEYYGG